MQNVLPSAVSSPWGTPNHEMRRALGRISTLLDAHPEFPDWISTDVDRGRRSRRGRAGLPCEVILRCGILKRLWQVDYRDLEFALLDSASAKQFARVNPLRSPKESVRGWREEALHGGQLVERVIGQTEHRVLRGEKAPTPGVGFETL